MNKLVKGYWDCAYCGTKGIDGDLRDCPGCGKPRGEDVKFYMKDSVEYLSEEEAAHASREADWYCSFCDSLNPADAEECKSCGASRADSEKNYHDIRREADEKAAAKEAKAHERDRELEKSRAKSKRFKILAVVGVVLIALILALMPKGGKATVDDFKWERSIAIESYQNVDESAWELPAGAELKSKASEIHHYDKVLDHYETITEEKSREVIDHYETEYEYKDLGNGNFEEVPHEVPVYTTEYYTETHEEPVYVDEPVYQTKYYYSIWKWIECRSVDTSGKDHKAEWGNVKLSDGEREGQRTGQYILVVSGKKIGTCEFDVPEDIWNNAKEGDVFKIKRHAGGEIELLDGGKTISRIKK